MPSPTTDGGAQVAPPPTFAHQLSKQPSNQDIESAQLLERLHNDQGPSRRETSHTEATSAAAPVAAQSERLNPSERKPEVIDVTEYHALEDSLRHAQDPASSSPGQPPNVLIARQQMNNAPITGQICRYQVRRQPYERLVC